MAIKNILFVDDERPIVDLAKRFLEVDGYTIDALTNPADALNRFEPGKYDLIITDNRMPGMTGVELATQIRQRSSQQRILLVTSCEPSQVQPLFDLLLLKPFTRSGLRQAVVEATDGLAPMRSAALTRV